LIRRAVGGALVVAVLLDAIVLLFQATGVETSLRFGPLWLRAHDLLKPLMVGAGLWALLALAVWRVRIARRLALSGVALLLLSTLATLARQARVMFPIGDGAVLESNTQLLLRGQLLLGAYSRFAWHHPGPLLFFVLSPFYLLAGQNTAGLNAGALAINVAALVATLWMLSRRGSRALVVVVAAAMAFYGWRVQAMLASFWNPHLEVFPTVALVAAAAGAAAGDLVLLPVVAFFASFIGQTHVGMMPPALAMAGFAAVGATLARREGTPDARLGATMRRALNLTTWFVLLLWLLPIADEVGSTPGNITLLVRFFTLEQHGLGHPFSTSFDAWSGALLGAFRPTFQIAWGGAVAGAAAWWQRLGTPVLVVLTAGAGWRAWRANRRYPAALAASIVLLAVVGLWSITHIGDDIIDHEIFWLSALGVLGVSVLAAEAIEVASVVPVVPPRVAAAATILGCTAFVSTFAALGATEFVRGLGQPGVESEDERIVRAMYEGLRAYMDEAHVKKPLLRINQPAWGYAAGLVVQLERAGIPFAIEDGAVSMFTDAVRATGDEDAEIWVVSPKVHEEFAARNGNVVVAARDPVYADAMPMAPNRNR